MTATVGYTPAASISCRCSCGHGHAEGREGKEGQQSVSFMYKIKRWICSGGL